MALFGDLGKALGLGNVDTGDALALAGTAAGFYFGGPGGAALGSGIGSLAGGKSVNDALTNAALAYGVTNFVSPNLMSSSAQASTSSVFGPTSMQKSLYSVPTGTTGTTAAPMFDTSAGVDPGLIAGDVGTEAATSGGIGEFFSGMDTGDYLLAGSLGLGAAGALGLLGGPEEPQTGPRQPDPQGEAWDVMFQGETYDLDDPAQKQAYTQAKTAAQKPDFQYDLDAVRFAEGGAMGYDVPVRGEVAGPGTGTSDSVPARLSDGEFVLTAKAVRGAGGGDRDMGAARLYDMMAELEATA
jgi:hypothetical protein